MLIDILLYCIAGLPYVVAVGVILFCIIDSIFWRHSVKADLARMRSSFTYDFVVKVNGDIVEAIDDGKVMKEQEASEREKGRDDHGVF